MWQPNNQDNFKELVDRAMSRITLGHVDNGRNRAVHVHARPPFSNPVSWQVFDTQQPIHKTQPTTRELLVRQVVWKRDINLQRSSESPPWSFDPIPTYEVSKSELDFEPYDQLIDAGGQISVPLLRLEEPFGLDGTHYGFRAKGCKLDWWQYGPKEWQLFTHWVRGLIGFLDEALETSNTD